MKSTFAALSLTFLFVFLARPAHAQCPQGPTGSCVTSFTLDTSTIVGDNMQVATGTAVAHLASGSTQFLLEIQQGTSYRCVPPATPMGANAGGAGYTGGCAVPASPGTATINVQFFSQNSGSSSFTTNVIADVGYSGDPGITRSITVLPVPSPSGPSADPDTRCPDCNSGSKPINFSNGNTWIEQTDYAIPGLGGGLALTRTWNSLWSLAQPVEQSGIFGDSWRSNFEERVEVLAGGIAKYWKGDGGKFFYGYSGGSGTYGLTAPFDEQTGLAYNSSTTLWTVTEKDGSQKIFNSAGYLTALVDRNGNTTTINLDSAHQYRISTVVDAAGRTLTFNYTNGTFPRLCTSIVDSVGTVATYTYDSAGKLTRVQYVDGSQRNYNYASPVSNTLISSVTDSLSKVIEAHTYDSSRRGLTAQQANNASGFPVNKVTVRYGFPSANINQVCSSLSTCTNVKVTSIGQRTYLGSTSGDWACSTCTFHGSITGYALSSTGHKIAYTSGAYQKTSYFTYDTNGNITSRSLPAGDPFAGQTGYNTWTYTYNTLGEVLTATDPLGHTTTNTYDSHGNLLSTTTPSPDGGTTAGSTTSFTYSSAGQLLTITDPLNHATTLAYDSVGLLHTITDAQSHVTTYAYDARGNRTSVTDPQSHQTQFQYDNMNRLTLITYPDSSTVQFAYDIRGRRTSVTDQNNKTTTYTYDDADRLLTVTDATSHTTTYNYNTESDLTDIYDASGRHTTFMYLEPGHLYRTSFPSGDYESYSFDVNQNLTSKTDRKGNAITYYRDYQDRVMRKSYPSSSLRVDYTYDAAGRLTQVQDFDVSGFTKTGIYTFAYDDMNRLTQTGVNYAFDTAGNFTMSYGYDAASNRTSMTDPQSGSTSYSYDSLNRLTNIQDPQSHNFGFSYDTLSRRTQLTRPNSVNTNYTYDNLSRLLSVLHQNGSTTLDGASYTYDNAGNRTAKTNYLNSVSENYTYDNLYQLTGVSQGTTTTESYSYDPVGNRLSSLGVSPYSYNSSNRLTSTPSASYTYDLNGSTLTKVDSSGTTSYTWNYDDQLTQITLPAGGGTVTFKYDPFGRRIQKSSASGTMNYLYDGMQLIEEVDSSGNVLARYTNSAGIDDPLSQLRGGTTSYYQQDWLGSVTSLSNGSGTLANTYTYDSYGKLASSNGSIASPFQYTGREFDTETGIYQYRARSYDASTGRFLSEDPIRFGGGVNFYRYALNAPINFKDPLGLTATCYYAQSSGHLVCYDDTNLLRVVEER